MRFGLVGGEFRVVPGFNGRSRIYRPAFIASGIRHNSDESDERERDNKDDGTE